METKPTRTVIYVTGQTTADLRDELWTCLHYASTTTGEPWVTSPDLDSTVDVALDAIDTNEPHQQSVITESSPEPPLGKLVIYYDRAGTDAGLRSILSGVMDMSATVDIVVTDPDSLADRERGTDAIQEILNEGMRVHCATHGVTLQPGTDVDGATGRVIRTMSDSIHPDARGDDGDPDTYHHTGGRPPLGFTVDEDKRLVPDDDHDWICGVLQDVQDQHVSVRRASNKIGCARATIRNALDRPSMYNLR